MFLMALMGLLLLAGLVLSTLWAGTDYAVWDPGFIDNTDPGRSGDDRVREPLVRALAIRYLRGVAIALVGGFWAGVLVTGPAVRLIMRLLAVTADDSAQGRLTEADEVVGNIDVGGTIGLIVFGGILPGLASAGIYVLFRRWLPSGWLGGVTFGLLHLVFLATRLDPLRPENRDFDLVGPGWLAVLTFGTAAVLHGMAVVAIANRFSTAFPSRTPRRARRRWPEAIANRFSASPATGAEQRPGPSWSIAPLVPPAMALVVGFPLLLPIAAGLVIAIAAGGSEPVVRAARGRTAVLLGRAIVGVGAVALLPATIGDLKDIIG